MNKFRSFETIIIFLILIPIIFFYTEYFLPQEDAAILFRYAENLFRTGEITYNLEGVKTEGATDFLWMILLAFLNNIYFNTFFWSVVINIISLVILSIKFIKFFKLKKIYAYIFFTSHLFIPFAWGAALVGFSVFLVELILFLTIIYFEKEKTFKFLFFSFLGCLIRPDFILFIFFVNIFYLFTKIEIKKILLYTLFIFCGLIYFYWRYKYFDEFLPLPYYVKSTWEFLSNKQWARYIIIFSPIVILFLDKKFIEKFLNNKKNYIIIFSYILIPTIYYSFQTLYQNVGQRFYFYFYIVLFFLIFKNNNYKKINKINLIYISIIIIFNSFIFHGFYAKEKFPNLKKNFPVYNFANEIKKIKNLKIAVTEAGHLPYYSSHYSEDLFGLNTKKFSKAPAGGKYLQTNYFDLIYINTGQMGASDCNAANLLFKKTKNIEIKYKMDRKTNWDNFTLNLFGGIDKKIYNLYLIKRNRGNVFLFVNKKNREINLVAQNLKLTKC